MIVCRSCGHQNVDDAEFCASCRTYLAWDGDRVPTAAPPAPPPPTPPPAAPERRPGLVDQVLGAVGRSRAPASAPNGAPAGQSAAQPAAPAGGGSAFPPGPSAQAAPPGGAHPPGPGVQTMPAGGGAFPPGPSAQGGPGSAIGPQPVQPAPERELPPLEPILPPGPARRPGARYCSVCGADNDADRRLCRSCGTELLLPTAKRPSWWRRLFGRSAPTAAGERPGRRRRARGRRGRQLFRAIVGGVLVAALVLLVGPWRGVVSSGYRKVKSLVTTQYDAVKPLSARATSEARSRPARNAIDGVKNSAWAEGVRGPGVNQSITITLSRKVDLARIGITPGASDVEKTFRAQSRPERIRLVFGNGTEQTVTLSDEAKFQEVAVSAAGVDRVTLVLLSAYPGQSGTDTSIAEVEFYTKR